MNAVIVGVMLMLILTLCRINVIVAMTVSAIVAGLTATLVYHKPLMHLMMAYRAALK